jgi:competence ComEA-like helix-hairpin-helix protein
MWKDFFYFSKRERQGILVLIALVAGIFIGKFLFTPKISPVENPEKQIEKESVTSETVESGTKKDYYSPPDKKSAYPRQKQRNNQPENRNYYPQAEKTAEAPTSNVFPKSEKFPEGTVIELNTSDTTELMKIPGIGSSYARKITGYRSVLGGFYRNEQLQEVYGMYEELYEKIIPYLKINPDEIIRIQANSASIEKLKSHPYLNFYQAKAIIDLRKKKGKLENIRELSLLEEFTEEDLEKINHYLAF